MEFSTLSWITGRILSIRVFIFQQFFFIGGSKIHFCDPLRDKRIYFLLPSGKKMVCNTRIAICFTSGENELLPMSLRLVFDNCTFVLKWENGWFHNCYYFPVSKQTVPNKFGGNCTFTACFEARKWLFSPLVGKIAAVVKSAFFPSQNRR